MNPLLKKEIRLLLPALGLTLLLVFGSVFFFADHGDPKDVISNFTPVWLGVMILCASSFGREFSLGTFSALLAQPVPRRQYWMTKVGVLAAALVSVLLAYCLCTYPALLSAMGWPETAWLVLLLLTAIASGLWMALLIRQMMAVIWLVGLVPGLLCVPFLLVLSHFGAADQTVEITVYVLLTIYSAAGIAGSWLIFQRAQDVPWSGGTINLPEWMTAKIMPRSATEERLKVPWRALIRKEFHFNQVLLFGMAGLFLFDLGEVGVRFLRGNSTSDFNVLLTVAGILLWVLMPLIIGCTSVAEERKLGTLEGQLCQPVSARRQFLVKLGFVLIFGGVLSTGFPYMTEGLALWLGIDTTVPPVEVTSAMMAGMCAIALIGFFASSLARNVLQALPIALATILGTGFVVAGLFRLSGINGTELIPGFMLWNPVLPCAILVVLLPAALVWLAWRNFRSLHETARIWRRNSLVLAGVLVFTMVASVLIYHRAWDKLTPFEPAHGPPRWTLSQPPVALRTDLNNNFLISLPDGRYWFGCLAPQPPMQIHNQFLRIVYEMLPAGAKPRLQVDHLIPGADWVSVLAGYADFWAESGESAAGQEFTHIVAGRETVGVRSDGTLWVSETATGPAWNTTPLVQFGIENDWKQVFGDRSLSSVFLLKQNGTLWRWGAKTGSWSKLPPHWAGLRSQTPHQIGTNSDWQQLLQVGLAAAQKTDGSVWHLWFNTKEHRDDIVLDTNLPMAGFTAEPLDNRKIAGGFPAISAGIHPDGTLWIWGDNVYWDSPRYNKFTVLQSSRETNWVTVALGAYTMIALKSDGTLWRWGGGHDTPQYADAFTSPPARLGSHNDWVALTQTWVGVVSLAADGSLWLWPDSGTYYDGGLRLIEPPQKPISLGNVLAAK